MFGLQVVVAIFSRMGLGDVLAFVKWLVFCGGKCELLLKNMHFFFFFFFSVYFGPTAPPHLPS